MRDSLIVHLARIVFPSQRNRETKRRREKRALRTFRNKFRVEKYFVARGARRNTMFIAFDFCFVKFNILFFISIYSGRFCSSFAAFRALLMWPFDCRIHCGKFAQRTHCTRCSALDRRPRRPPSSALTFGTQTRNSLKHEDRCVQRHRAAERRGSGSGGGREREGEKREINNSVME